jgi:hypothetical protein
LRATDEKDSRWPAYRQAGVTIQKTARVAIFCIDDLPRELNDTSKTKVTVHFIDNPGDRRGIVFWPSPSFIVCFDVSLNLWPFLNRLVFLRFSRARWRG